MTSRDQCFFLYSSLESSFIQTHTDDENLFIRRETKVELRLYHHPAGYLTRWLLAPGVATPHSFARCKREGACSGLILSLLVAPEFPATWPANWPFFQTNPYLRVSPHSAYKSEILTIDGNTGTQLDFPPHSIPAPDKKLPNAGPLGLAFSETTPAWQFVGEACS